MFDIQEELKKLPHKPGVYIMKNENKEIIYIGKAVVLKNRVRQYFQNSSNHTPKVKAMVPKIKEFEYIVTDSELEALILECNLIKKYKPKYNILLKDDKSYPYIKVTMNEEYPRVFMTRRLEKDGAKYFGPYSNTFAVKETIELIKKLFPLKACKKILPRDIGKSRPCLNFYIHQCLGPCQGGVNIDEYRTLMKDICDFLSGRHEDVIKRLEKQMIKLSDEMEFEKAADLRDKITSLKHIFEKQKVLSTAMEDQDVIAFANSQNDYCVQVFFIRGGKLIGREHFVFDGIGQVEDKELLSSFIKQFYNASDFIPREIILQQEIDEINIIERWLSDKRGLKVHLKVPQKGERKHLVEMVSQNALISLNQFIERSKENNKRNILEELREMLGLDILPKRIEAYDISNTGVADKVASMVVFTNGLPSKKDYRKFKIKSIDGQNDYLSMQEVIYRRFMHAKKEQNESTENLAEASNKEFKFNVLPDLILLDGGLGHVSSVSKTLKEIDVNIPVFGMVKDDKHRTRGVVSIDGEIDMNANKEIFKLITSIQDEAHRFALEYNKKLREKRYRGSVLDEIDGIGDKRKKAILKYFGSVNRIKEAEIDELLKVEGMNRKTAENIYNHFR